MAVLVDSERRGFLKGAGAAVTGLVLGVHLPLAVRAQSGAAAVMHGDGAPGVFAPNAFILIAADDTVTVLIKHIEFGQGPFTGLSTLVAEELDADWSQMRAEHAPSEPESYKNLAFGIQGTGGSTAIANSYQQMRQAGAAARAMLVEAAAQRWGAPAQAITVDKGRIRHIGGGKEAGFGAFAEAAAKLTPPAEPRLKEPAAFRLIGTELPKLDTQAKSDGSARFTLDIRRDDMVTALVAHPSRFGGKVASFDATAAKKIRGVLDVREVPQGVAVYADGYWPAKKGRDALAIAWDDGEAEMRSSSSIVAAYKERAKTPGLPATVRGTASSAIKDAARTFEAEYVFPFLAHAPMEPLDAVIELRADGLVDAWLGSQLQTIDHQVIARTLGRDMANVRIHTMLAGGSFGRRAQPDSGFAAEAAAVAQAYGKTGVPVKLVWSREDDIQGGRYRPVYVHRLRGGIDGDGNIVGWEQTIVGQSIVTDSPFEAMIQDGIDPTSVEGAHDLPYAVPNLNVGLHSMKVGVPVLWWRSVGHTHTGYTTETFLDEMLHTAGKDQVAGRLALLNQHPRHAGVLRAVADLADWESAPPQGRARGVALHKSFGSYVAQIAEVSIGGEGLPKVHKVWCAIDCGVAVNPNVIRAQIEGGVGYGLGAVLYDEITLEDGKVVQANFDTYRSLRLPEMPEVDVRVVASAEAPTGVGEPGVPPVGPAVAIAWHRLTGQRVRTLPFSASVSA